MTFSADDLDESNARQIEKAVTRGEDVHLVGDAPTSLHGNGAASFNQTMRDVTRVTCGLCRVLMRRGGDPYA